MTNLKSTRLVRNSWYLLIGLSLIFVLLYLYSALFPGPMQPAVTKFFSQNTAIQARLYNTTPRILSMTEFILQAVLLIGLLFSSLGQTLFRRFVNSNTPYWQACVFSILSLWCLLKILALPFSFFISFYWQKIWGFSTQSQAAWWIDYFKSAGIDLIITLLGGLIFFWLVNRFSRSWWIVGTALFSLFLVIQYLLWPIVISPLFNRFEPVQDAAVVTMVKDLAQQAGLEISDVLVMDASSQTTLANAYFTGLGSTKRIVIYDNLLNNYSLGEVKAVIAHEMGHWRHSDVVHGLIWAMFGGFVVFALLTILLKPWLPEHSKKPPQLWAALQLALLLLLFSSNPIQNSLSRDMEYNADRFSLELTGDLKAAIQLQKDLADTSLADLSPSPFIVWFSYSHPPALARINALLKEAQQTNTAGD
ncbi:Zn-dependent protease with chaperone function [Desulfosporosinus orientis DSM 765]|uniref:Zn-dependent protease with chaperone function n=1 Tax=Desulfosporosinus orientis (strain ATCC 19365 / DSM 765 / NCIMB 8382 / VKM B-1628 / Singapore I) TaxID=768706 RepID=G7WG06_DESOD|nr:M48 family metallopeptidase [Desulfosporosinus orientis]AET69521.1 Zn-dependent protease with chaperone function [Desulfosporosinus orientis DSM 765]